MLLALLACGRGSILEASPSEPAHVQPRRSFQFESDAVAYANELTWSYEYDPETGRTITRPHVPRPAYTLRCFAVTRMVRQFFDHARFDPGEPKASAASYRHLVGLVMARNPRRASRAESKIVIPGYTNLREFSKDQEALLKTASGGAWQSFVQRGNWRMVFPFSRRHQQRTAENLATNLAQGRPSLVHMVCFPALTLNHAVLLFRVDETEHGFEFAGYDPNDPDEPVRVIYSNRERQFHFPRTRYFKGGAVNGYEIYTGVFF